MASDLGRLASSVDRGSKKEKRIMFRTSAYCTPVVGIEQYKNGNCIIGEKLLTQVWHRCVACSTDKKRKRSILGECGNFCGVRSTFRRDIYAVSLSNSDAAAFPAYCDAVDEAIVNNNSNKTNPCDRSRILKCLVPMTPAKTTQLSLVTMHDTIDRTENDVYLTNGIGVLNVRLQVRA